MHSLVQSLEPQRNEISQALHSLLLLGIVHRQLTEAGEGLRNVLDCGLVRPDVLFVPSDDIAALGPFGVAHIDHELLVCADDFPGMIDPEVRFHYFPQTIGADASDDQQHSQADHQPEHRPPAKSVAALGGLGFSRLQRDASRKNWQNLCCIILCC